MTIVFDNVEPQASNKLSKENARNAPNSRAVSIPNYINIRNPIREVASITV
jgi:hypothetical protein